MKTAVPVSNEAFNCKEALERECPPAGQRTKGRCALTVAAIGIAVVVSSAITYAAPPKPVSYRMITIPSPEGYYSDAFDVNNQGQVVGQYSSPSDGTVKPFVWSESTGFTTLPDFGIGGAAAINNCGEIVGSVGQLIVGPGEPEVVNAASVLWTPSGEMQVLNDVIDTELDLADPKDINDHGDIVGSAFDPALNNQQVAYLWSRQRGLIVLPMPEQGGIPVPIVLNNKGEVAGVIISSESPQHGFYWNERDGMIDIGTLGGSTTIVEGMNDKGEVVGSSETATGALHAFRWTQHRGMIDLTPDTTTNSGAFGINRQGQIIINNLSGSIDHPGIFLWSSNRQIPIHIDNPPLPQSLLLLTAVNDKAEIAGTRADSSDLRAMILIPQHRHMQHEQAERHLCKR